MAEWLKCTESFTAGLENGAQVSFFTGRNYKSDAPGVAGREHLFVSLDEDDAGVGTAQVPGTPARKAVPSRVAK
jgi:hypothetical protein